MFNVFDPAAYAAQQLKMEKLEENKRAARRTELNFEYLSSLFSYIHSLRKYPSKPWSPNHHLILIHHRNRSREPPVCLTPGLMVVAAIIAISNSRESRMRGLKWHPLVDFKRFNMLGSGTHRTTRSTSTFRAISSQCNCRMCPYLFVRFTTRERGRVKRRGRLAHGWRY